VIKGGGMIAVGLVAPKWLSAIARADVLRAAGGMKPSGDTVFVVCQFSGGNDGLNTVVPYADATYYQLRPTIGIPQDQVIHLDEHMGLHPGLAGLATLYKEGKVAIIQNVGYPNPNRSHFRSMDIWQSAAPDSYAKTGWIGRHLDQQLTLGPLNPVLALGLSTEKPLALTGQTASVPCFASLADVRQMVGDPDSERMLRAIEGGAGNSTTPTGIVQQAANSALDAMTILNKQLGVVKPGQTYAKDGFGQGFSQISQIILNSPATRVIYFQVGGFDTHAHQSETHQRLMKGFGDGVLAFQREMEAAGKSDKVVLMTFSEFGRRTHENASMGTDHGAAAPLFMVGGSVKGGFHGPIPNLQDLSDGDLKFAVDFREVYAAAIDNWMGGDSGVVLGQQFNPIGVFA